MHQSLTILALAGLVSGFSAAGGAQVQDASPTARQAFVAVQEEAPPRVSCGPPDPIICFPAVDDALAPAPAGTALSLPAVTTPALLAASDEVAVAGGLATETPDTSFVLTGLPAVTTQSPCIAACLGTPVFEEIATCNPFDNACACLSAPLDALAAIIHCVTDECTAPPAASGASPLTISPVSAVSADLDVATDLYTSYCISVFGVALMQSAIASNAAGSSSGVPASATDTASALATAPIGTGTGWSPTNGTVSMGMTPPYSTAGPVGTGISSATEVLTASTTKSSNVAAAETGLSLGFKQWGIVAGIVVPLLL